MSIVYIILYFSMLLQSFQLFAVSTYGFTLNDAMLCLLYAIVAKRMIWDGKPLKFSVHIPFVALVGLLVPVALSGLTPLWEGQGLIQLAKSSAHFIYGWLFAVIAAGVEEPPKTVTVIMRTLIIAGILIAAYGIYQVVARALDLPFAWMELNNVTLSLRKSVGDKEATQQLALKFSNFYRSTSIFSEPSVLAAFTTYFLVFLGIPYLQGERMFLRSAALNWLTFALYVAVLFLTFSLTGLAGVGLVCVLVFLLERGRRVFKILYGAVIIIACLSVVDILVAPITKISILELFGKRIIGIIEYGNNPYGEHTSGESFESRSEGIAIASDIWEYYPVNGTGLGRFSQAPPAQRKDIWFSTSTYSSVLAELGTIGFLVMLGLFVSTTALVLYWYKQRHQFTPELRRQLGIMPYFFILMTFLNFTGNGFISTSLWQFFGLVFLVTNNARREAGQPFVEFYLVRTPLRDIVIQTAAKLKAGEAAV